MNTVSFRLVLGFVALIFAGCVSAEVVEEIVEYQAETLIPREGVVLNQPYGVALRADGGFYLTDAGNNRVLVFGPDLNLEATWEEGLTSLGFGGLAVAPDGSVYVVDNGNFRIVKYSPGGDVVLTWGEEGTGDGQFTRAIGVAVAPDGTVYVTDDAVPYIQYFDKNGGFLGKWGGSGDGDGLFGHPTGLAVAPDGTVYVAD